MRFVRLLVLTAALSALAAVVVPGAHALRISDTPCIESGQIRVCPDAVVGQSYTIRLTGEGGCGPALPYQYRLLNGTLPPGLSLSKEGELSGTPTSAGTWDFWVEVSDQNPPSAAWCLPAKSERELRIRVGAPAATVGTTYSFALAGDGGSSRTWSLVSGILPAGLAFDATSVVIAGVPESPGSFPLTFSAIDTEGHVTKLDFTLTVYPRLTLTAARLAPVRVGRWFRAKVRTEGAIGLVSMRIVAGRFPVGVRLDGSKGLIRGTPRKAGIYRLTIQVRDSLGRVVTGSVTLTVHASSAKP